MFVATVKIAKVKVVSIIKLSDSLNVVSHNKDTEYEISVSRKDDGRMRVLVTSGNGGGWVEIDGAQTRLMDDLEFTKAMIAQENIVGPLMDSIRHVKLREEKEPLVSFTLSVARRDWPGRQRIAGRRGCRRLRDQGNLPDLGFA